MHGRSTSPNGALPWHSYYHNAATGVTTWTRPKSFGVKGMGAGGVFGWRHTSLRHRAMQAGQGRSVGKPQRRLNGCGVRCVSAAGVASHLCHPCGSHRGLSNIVIMIV